MTGSSVSYMSLHGRFMCVTVQPIDTVDRDVTLMPCAATTTYSHTSEDLFKIRLFDTDGLKLIANIQKNKMLTAEPSAFKTTVARILRSGTAREEDIQVVGQQRRARQHPWGRALQRNTWGTFVHRCPATGALPSTGSFAVCWCVLVDNSAKYLLIEQCQLSLSDATTTTAY